MSKILNPVTGKHIEDRTGEHYGEWVVLGLDQNNTNKKTKWMCRCSCGTEKALYVSSLINGSSKSCGCTHHVPDLVGKQFGRLIVVEMRRTDSPRRRVYWHCHCECGNEVEVETGNLVSGSTMSCGCLRREKMAEQSFRHGHGRERIYKNFLGMHQRCENPNDKQFHRYGGRGIFVCDEWHDFNNFYQWAISNGYKKGLTIDRKDVNGPYAPWNCRWATAFQQGNNRRNTIWITYNGKRQTISEWAIELNINRQTIYARHKKGLPPDQILAPTQK